nr:MAG TPA: hypothetical protein [Caudoviricetes sp.]DAR72099.1 MAG TPA: hypothetical protein [Caudoviricetes sp.]DAY01631.1 MAG TPA: hypothetical protein [Caudoviricetes sp.]
MLIPKYFLLSFTVYPFYCFELYITVYSLSIVYPYFFNFFLDFFTVKSYNCCRR